MSSERNSKKIKNWRISSARNESSAQADAKSFDDNERLNSKANGSPKFLRTQSSNGILASPRNIMRIFGSLRYTGNSSDSSDSFCSSKSSIRDDKNCSNSSLNSLTRLVSPPNRKTHESLKQSKCMRSKEQIIDEDSELGMPCDDTDHTERTDMSASMSNSMEFNVNSSLQSTTPASRLLQHRMQHFRRRSISWDSQFAKALMRYDFYAIRNPYTKYAH